jgi:hypothetical protein
LALCVLAGGAPGDLHAHALHGLDDVDLRVLTLQLRQPCGVVPAAVVIADDRLELAVCTFDEPEVIRRAADVLAAHDDVGLQCQRCVGGVTRAVLRPVVALETDEGLRFADVILGDCVPNRCQRRDENLGICKLGLGFRILADIVTLPFVLRI